ncbi:MAG: c-type cytochrome [Pseudomonadota bacterium]|nr:c-type cytochrome [Pseudomonadota bacterium]
MDQLTGMVTGPNLADLTQISEDEPRNILICYHCAPHGFRTRTLHYSDRQIPKVFTFTVGLLASAASQIGIAADASPLTGPQVYNNVCIACHSPPGVGGAPALGNAEAWGPRIAQGVDVLIAHAINGFSGKTGIMPRKGERPDLSDEEVAAAVRYMVEQIPPGADK